MACIIKTPAGHHCAIMMSSALSGSQTVSRSGQINQQRQHGRPAVVISRNQPMATLHPTCPVHVPFRAATLHRGLSTASRSRARLGAAGLKVCAEQSYVMIKPDGVQRGLVRHPLLRSSFPLLHKRRLSWCAAVHQ